METRPAGLTTSPLIHDFGCLPSERRLMYDRDTLVLHRHYLEQGMAMTAIAAQLGLSRTIHHCTATGQLER